MAHHQSAKKRIRQTAKRTQINRARTSRIRTFIKKVELAVASGDREAAQTALRAAEPEIRRGVNKGVLKLNTASRRISRLSKKVNTMAEAARP
jgi:small subunit ribosomal protein S20